MEVLAAVGVMVVLDCWFSIVTYFLSIVVDDGGDGGWDGCVGNDDGGGAGGGGSVDSLFTI